MVRGPQPPQVEAGGWERRRALGLDRRDEVCVAELVAAVDRPG